mmetsp:Transcript_51357/g.159208  ORF Transcript_51357/g.159208 Transcript_51357/m.159208 type:complete len:97 (-) Transcript_51357:12-302(-)
MTNVRCMQFRPVFLAEVVARHDASPCCRSVALFATMPKPPLAVPFCSVATCIGGESETYLQISWRADLHVGQASECICSSRRIALFDAGTIERKDA